MSVKIGFIPSNWESWDGSEFTGKWAGKMRDRCVAALEQIPGIELVVPSRELTADGCVSTVEDGKKTLELFRREQIQGLIVGNMTFGMEVALGTVLNELPRELPVIHFATKSGAYSPQGNRATDTWCGQFMSTSALKRRGFTFEHIITCDPEEERFAAKMRAFIRAVNAIAVFKGAKFGQVGTRPQLFESQSWNEKLMQKKFGQMVVPMDLATAFSIMDSIREDDPRVKEVLSEIKGCAIIGDVHTEQTLINQARYEVSLMQIKQELDVDALAVNCWTQIQSRYGISACSTFARLNDKGCLTACEMDLEGAVTMLIFRAAGLDKTPPVFIDWTDLHPTEPNTWLAWHCGNAAPSTCAAGCSKNLLRNERMIQWNPECHGAIEFAMKSGPVTCGRLVEYDGQYALFYGTGDIVDIGPMVRGTYGWVKVNDLTDWETKMVDTGVIHHGVLIHDAEVAEALGMFCRFLGITAVRGL